MATNLNSIFAGLTGAAKTLLPLMVPGAGPLLKAGEAIVSAIDHLKQSNGGQAPADALQVREALMTKVRAHAESTAGRLEGGG
jgi:hypothetical protein